MFHVSSIDLGKVIEMIPKIPHSRSEGEESTIPRVCFAPTIKQCLMGIDGIDETGLLKRLKNKKYQLWMHNYTVYQCNTPELLIPAGSARVPDFHRTCEHWSLVPIMVERIGVVADFFELEF